MSLEETKQHLSRKYLGKEGIHGVGLSKVRDAVRIHLSAAAKPEQEARQQALLEELKREAAPYEVMVAFEERSEKS